MNKLIQHRLKKLVAFSILLSIFSISSCRKLVESEPPSDSVTDITVFSTDATAIAVLNGIYATANNRAFQGSQSIALLAGLDADELTLFGGVTTNYALLGHYKNALAQSPGSPATGSENWSWLYNFIFRCTAVIEGLGVSKSLAPPIKKQLLGEAQFFRALCYFYLVNLYGDVPLPISTDSNVNSQLSRSPVVKVYEQIIADLKEAETNLSENFLSNTLLSNTPERVRPTKWAAVALLARVYLYTGNNWAKAEEKATAVIGNTTLFGPLPAVNDVFLKNSPEAIWQLQPTAINFNTNEAKTFVLPASGPNANNNPVYLSNSLLGSFEAGDQRAVIGNWVKKVTAAGITYPFSFKYKVNSSPGVTDPSAMTEYFMMLRLGEQYLIRAEARAHLGNIGGAQADLNAIRNRAGLPNTTANTEATLVTAILNERRHELFCEGGHRWLDLKRTNTIDAVMNIETPLKAPGTVWHPYQALYPLPLLTDLQRNPKLTQNPGY